MIKIISPNRIESAAFYFAILLITFSQVNAIELLANEDSLMKQLHGQTSVQYLQTENNHLQQIESNRPDVVELLKYKDGLEILGNRIFVHLGPNGDITSIEDDSTVNLQTGNKNPSIMAKQAAQVAVNSFDKLKTIQSISRLVWFRKADQGILAWQIETELAPSDGICSATHILTTVDANNGQILSQSQRGGDVPEIDPATGNMIVPVRSPIVINNTAGTAQAQSFGADFPAVCSPTNGGCSGTLIAPNVVLGARHCGDSPGDLVRFGHNRNNPDFTTTVQSVSFPGGGNAGSDITNGGDVAILILNSNVPANVAAPMRLTTETNSLIGTIGTFAGYGGQGVGTNGQGPVNGFRWAGQNIIDRFGFPTNIFSADFDDGTPGNNSIPGSSPTPLPLEAMVAQGDSGGALFVEIDDELVIVGVASFVSGSGNISSFGWSGFWTGSAEFRTQIEAVGGEFIEGVSTPPNDDWADRINIASVPGSTGGTNVNATTQSNEQNLDETGATVWWSVTAPATGIMTVDTFGSNFNTQLQIFTDSENGFENLQTVASNDDSMGSSRSLVSFPVIGGQSYDIRVGGFSSGGGFANQGSVQLSIDFSPEGPTDFFFSLQNGGAFNTSNAQATLTTGTSGSIYVYFDPTNSDIDTGAFFDIQTSVPGVIEFTNAEAFEFDITADGIPFGVRWGDAFGETGTVTSNSIDEWGAFTVVSGDGMISANTGPVILDQGYDISSGAFLFGRIDFNVIGSPGTSVDIIAGPGDTGIVHMGSELDAGIGSIRLNVEEPLPPQTDFFWSFADLAGGAVNDSMPVGNFAEGTSGSMYLYFDPMIVGDIDTGAFFDLQTSAIGVIEFTNAETFEFDITVGGTPFSVRWGDAFGETGTVTSNMIDEWGAFTVVGGEGMLTSNTGPTFFDEGYDMSAGAFLFGRVDFNVIGSEGDSVDVMTSVGETGVVHMGMLLDPTIGISTINIGEPFLLGDINCDGAVNLLDVQPFVDLLTNGEFSAKADINQDGSVDLLDVDPFVSLLSGS